MATTPVVAVGTSEAELALGAPSEGILAAELALGAPSEGTSEAELALGAPWKRHGVPWFLPCVSPFLLSLFPVVIHAAENLVQNGAFEVADPTDPGRPKGWGRIDGLGIRWEVAPVDPGGTASGKALRFDTAVSERDMMARWAATGITEWNIPDASKGPVGASYGLSLYSDGIPIQEGKPYVVEVRHRGPGGGKIWVRGYTQRGDALKRIYEAQTDLPTAPTWTTTSYAFHPTRHTPKVTEVKIMLFAYWPAKESWFDDVVLREATAAELATEDAPLKKLMGR